MSSLPEARAELADALTSLLPGFAVFPDVQPIDDVARPTLALVRTRVEPLPAAPRAAWLNTFQLFVIVPSNAGEDALDDALEAVILALDTITSGLWTGADRTVWEDICPAYAVTLTTPTRRTDN
jgi:hypothetical protein